MPRTKLTDRRLRALSTNKELEEFIDDDFRQAEFGVRLSDSGRKAFFLRYRVNGRRRRLSLGLYPALSLAAARSKALEAVAAIQDGKDPAKIRKQERKADSAGALFEAFMKQKETSFARTTYRNYWSMWKKDCEKPLGDIKANDVERRQIIAILDSIEARTHAPHMVNRTRSMLMSLFNWGMNKDRCKHNPVLGVPKAQKRELPSERFLSREEIRVYWQSTEDIDATERAFWRLLILLALRPGEVMKLRWNWIDGDVLTLPGSQVKNKKEHQLYLTDMARSEIEQLQAVSGHTEHLFPGIPEGTPRKDFGEAHERLHKVMNVPHWTPRDIRRTCETQMRTFIRDSEGISRVLNHDIGTLRRHYDKGDYFARKRDVLTQWSQWLTRVVDEQQVVVYLADHREQKKETAAI